MAIFGRKREDGPGAPAADTNTMTTTDARDAELGVPPFRPAPKDAPAMSLPPKPTAAPATPVAGARPGAAAAIGVPARPPQQQARPEPSERRTLVVGRGISLQGTVSDAERLAVEGTVESEMIQAAELYVAQSGVFRGEVQVEDAEIAGLFDGTITVRGNLVIRSTGKLTGTARYRKLSVEEGGQVSGRMEMLSEQQATAPLGGGGPAPRPPVVLPADAEV